VEGELLAIYIREIDFIRIKGRWEVGLRNCVHRVAMMELKQNQKLTARLVTAVFFLGLSFGTPKRTSKTDGGRTTTFLWEFILFVVSVV
jgi:hypothetical protein